MQQFLLCSFENHESEPLTGICLGNCSLDPWICRLCMTQSHKSHLKDCQIFEQIIASLESMTNSEKRKVQMEQAKLDELIKIQAQIVKDAQNNVQQYEEWLTLIKNEQYQDPKITKMIDFLKNNQQMNCQKNNLLKLLQPSSRSPDEIYQDGSELYAQGNYSVALQNFEMALEKDPNHINSLCGKGDYLFYKRRMLLFQQHFQIIKLNGQYLQALECYDQVLEKNPNQLHSLSAGKVFWIRILGDCLRMLNKFQEAYTCYEKALKLDRENLNSLCGLSLCLRENGFNEKAFSVIRSALEINSEFWLAWYEKGLCLQKMQKFKQAILCYDKVLQLNSNHPEIELLKKQCQQKFEEM